VLSLSELLALGQWTWSRSPHCVRNKDELRWVELELRVGFAPTMQKRKAAQEYSGKLFPACNSPNPATSPRAIFRCLENNCFELRA
jgi:hypothetical protein